MISDAITDLREFLKEMFQFNYNDIQQKRRD